MDIYGLQMGISDHDIFGLHFRTANDAFRTTSGARACRFRNTLTSLKHKYIFETQTCVLVSWTHFQGQSPPPPAGRAPGSPPGGHRGPAAARAPRRGALPAPRPSTAPRSEPAPAFRARARARRRAGEERAAAAPPPSRAPHYASHAHTLTGAV